MSQHPASLSKASQSGSVDIPLKKQMQADSAICFRILPLPEDVAVQISSSTAIASLTSVVLGLLENSLDAGAKEIDIGVDFRRASCTVEDDGHGIAPEEFVEEGGLGKRFYTSKYNNPGDLYGGQGTFLSSVAALSILSIISRQFNCTSQSTLILHHSRSAARSLKSQSHNPSLIYSHGTQVIVQDLFGSMPVRVKQRSLLSSEGAKYETKEFEYLKRSITAILLSFHKPVHICLHQLGEKGLARKIHIGKKAENGAENVMFSSRIEIPILCRILTHGGYIDPSGWDSWIKASARTSEITLHGAISLRPAPSKHVQFMSLGKRPLDPERGHNILYEEVNRLFSLSTFGVYEETSGRNDPKRQGDKRYKTDGFTNRQLKGQRKGVDRWPMFYIRIDLGEQDDTKRLEREATMNKVIKVLGAMIYGFLKNNHFRPHALTRSPQTGPASRGKLSSLKGPPTSDNAFSTWSRIKSSTRAESGMLSNLKMAAEEPHQEVSEPTLEADLPKATEVQKTLPLNAVGEEIIEWRNPVSKASVFINSRTGLAVARPHPARRPITAPAELQRPNSTSRLTRTTSQHFMTPQKGSWTDDLLSKWENPVFAPPSEAPISRASFEDPHLDIFRTKCEHTSGVEISKAFYDSASLLSTRLSKASLRSAHIIAQVDKKFILTRVSTPQAPALLVLIDQHAADERIRIESFLHDLQTQKPVPITKPLVFDVPTKEHELFTIHAPFFEHWGITYNLPVRGTDSSTIRTTTSLEILTLPPTIAARCQSDPKILISFLRTEVWSLHTSPSRPTSSSSSSSASSTPPQGIMDILTSRACRSAIMFNDVLSLEEMRTLVEKLAGTQRPWACAHGRPSMVPIVEVGGGGLSSTSSKGTTEERDRMVSFRDAWAGWWKGNHDH